MVIAFFIGILQKLRSRKLDAYSAFLFVHVRKVSVWHGIFKLV